jgi:F0F1-type ATP synthase delta subunit
MLSKYSAEQLVPVLAAEVVRNGMTTQLDLLLHDINNELLHSAGQIEVEVVSAYDITDGIRQQLVEAIEGVTGAKQVTLNHRLDPNVIGGVVAKTPELEFNITIEDKLRRLAA